jgi:hypothetical protein
MLNYMCIQKHVKRRKLPHIAFDAIWGIQFKGRLDQDGDDFTLSGDIHDEEEQKGLGRPMCQVSYRFGAAA